RATLSPPRSWLLLVLISRRTIELTLLGTLVCILQINNLRFELSSVFLDKQEFGGKVAPMNRLEDLLKPLVLKALVLDVRKARTPLPLTASKFGGVPYHEPGEDWPKCPSCTKSLAFICQLDLSRTSHPARESVPFFTFFYCWHCSPWGYQSERKGEWVV